MSSLEGQDKSYIAKYNGIKGKFLKKGPKVFLFPLKIDEGKQKEGKSQLSTLVDV